MTTPLSQETAVPQPVTESCSAVRPALTVACVCLVLSLMVALVVSTLITNTVRERNGHMLAELAYHMTETLDNGLYERFNSLLLFSQLSEMPRFLNNPQLLQHYFNQQQRLFPEYAWIGFVRPDGTVLAGAGGLLEGKNILAREWVRAGMKAPFAGDVHEALLLSSLLPRPQDGEPLRLVDLALPVHDANNRLLGVLGAHLSWEWAKELRMNLQSHNLQDRLVEILVLNQEGKVLLGSSGSGANGTDLSQLASYRQAKEFKEGFLTERWPDGNRYITGYARSKGRNHFKGLGWIVLTRQSTAAVQSEALTIRLKALGMGGLLGLAAGMLCWFTIQRKLAPLEQLTRAVQLDATESAPPPPLGHDLFSTVARSIYARLHDGHEQIRQLRTANLELQHDVEHSRSVAQRLAEQRRSLELQILERTQDTADLAKELQQTRELLAQTQNTTRDSHGEEKR